jgi:N utilization substance protein A
MKGMRVQSIIRELRGEKIDIIEYSEDSVVFAGHALSPAKVSRITVLDPLEKHMEVIVDDSQLSLAIGKKGQNVRLAAKLLGWKIDIKSEEEKRQEVESQMAALVAPGAPVGVLIDYGLPEQVVEKLAQAGIGTVERLGEMTPEQLEEIQGVGPKMVEKIQETVEAYYSQFEEPASTPAAEAPSSETPHAEAAPGAAAEIEVEIEAPPAGEDSAENPAPEGAEAAAEQFGTMVDASSPPDNPQGAGPEQAPSAVDEVADAK